MTGICYGLGVGPVPFVLMSEMFGVKVHFCHLFNFLSYEKYEKLHIMKMVWLTSIVKGFTKIIKSKEFYFQYKSEGMAIGMAARCLVAFSQLKVTF